MNTSENAAPVSESRQPVSHQPGNHHFFNTLMRYGLAVVSITAGLLLRFALELPVGKGLPTYVTYYPFVMLTALVGGFGPGLFATILTLLAVYIWGFPPAGQLSAYNILPVEVVGFFLFAFMGVFISIVAALYRRNRAKAAAYDREQSLAQSRKEKEFLAELLQNAEQPFAVGYTDGSLLLFNRAFETLTGYTSQELSTINWSTKLTPPEWREPELRKIEELNATGKPVRYEKEYIRKDGLRVPIELLTHIGRENESSRVYYYAFITDLSERRKTEAKIQEANARIQQHAAEVQIVNNQLRESRLAALNLAEDADAARKHAEETSRELLKEISERKQTEDALRASESRFRGIFYNAAIGIFQVDINDQLISVNDYLSRILGYSREQLLSFNVHHLTAPEDWATSDELNAKIHKKELNSIVYEKRYLKADGSRIWVNVTVSSIRDKEDRHIGAVSTVEDISLRKKIEFALRASEERFRTMFETHGAVMLLIEPDNGSIVDANTAAEAFYGYSRRTLRSMRIHQINQESAEKVTSALQKTVKHERTIFEFRHRISSGMVRTVEVYSSPVQVSGKSLLFSIIQDITERKQVEESLQRRTEELAAANCDLESFSYSVSHDLQNPLGIIGGFTTILIEDYAEKLDRDGQDYLRRISDGVKRMQALIKDMLALSRIGRQEMNREDVNFSAIARNYLQELESTEPQREAELDVSDNIHADADPRLIHLAMENLLRNAWKFTSQKKITHIEFGTVHQDGTTVFFIRDNGVGFDTQQAQKIFEPFKRVHKEKEFGGTGVGLSIVQRVIERHGGKVWAEGKVGEGATFYFTLGNGH